MFEAFIAAAIVLALLAAAMIPPMTLLWLGAIVGGIGAVSGIPAGLVYHARLWRALRAAGLDTTGMWLRPHLLHDRLPEHARGPVVAWFAVGAVGFGLTLLGATAILTAIVRLAAH